MTGNPGAQACPKCGSALIWNGRTTSCLACSYVAIEAKSDKKIPAARSKKKDKRPGGG